MFSKIVTFFRTVEHDVEAIISNFTTTIGKLEAAAAAKLEEAQNLTKKAQALDVEASIAHDASQKAAAVAAKIKDLIAH